MEINKTYEKKGHEFIDVFVNLFDQRDEMCVMTINLTAIYNLGVLKRSDRCLLRPRGAFIESLEKVDCYSFRIRKDLAI